MAHLNIDNEDEFLHLVQLFLHAHPAYRAEHAQVLAASGTQQPCTYFLSKELSLAMLRWGRAKHLLTRKDAQRYRDTIETTYRTPDEAIPLRPVVLGTPPLRQWGVLASDVHGWLYAQAPDRTGEDLLMRLPMARQICEGMAAHGEEPEPVRARAVQLAAWLTEQEYRPLPGPLD